MSDRNDDCTTCGGFGYTVDDNGESGYMTGCAECSIAAQEAEISFALGDKVTLYGYSGVVASVYEAPTTFTSGMYVVRLGSGDTCVSGVYIRRAA